MSCCDGDEGDGHGCTCGYRAAEQALERANQLGQKFYWTRSFAFPGHEESYIDGYLFTRPTTPGMSSRPQPRFEGEPPKVIRTVSTKFDANSHWLSPTYINLRSSEDHITHYLRLAGHEFLPCAQDHHFEQFVFKEIITFEQTKAVIAMLNADRQAMEGGNKKFFCQKTYGLTNLKDDMVKFPNLTGAYYLASIRRIHCSCHEVGSFALSSNYTSKMHQIYKNERGDSIWYTGCK